MWKHLRYELYPMVETSKDRRSKKILCYLTPSGPWTHKHENRFLSLVIKSADFCRFVYSFKQSTNGKDTSSNFPQAPTIGWFSPQFYTIYSNFSPPAKYSLDNLFVVLSQYLKLTFNSIFSEYVFHLFCIKHRTHCEQKSLSVKTAHSMLCLLSKVNGTLFLKRHAVVNSFFPNAIFLLIKMVFI